MYLTQGYIGLDANTKVLVQQNIQNILEDEKEYTGKNFEYQCPFLINGECCVYKYRGLVCRTYGICYYDDIRCQFRMKKSKTKYDNQVITIPEIIIDKITSMRVRPLLS